MKLRTEILFIFLAVGVILTLITGALFIYNAQSIILKAAGNQLESLSSAKKHRIESVIDKKKEELQLVQSRLVNTEHLFLFNTFNKHNDEEADFYKKLINDNLVTLKKEIPSFKNIHILNKKGITIASTDTSVVNFNFSILDFVEASLQGQNKVSSFIDEANQKAYLCLSAPLFFKKNIQGAVVIETTTTELNTLTGDYTGLGNTGETVIVQKISDTLACYITPTRDKSDNLHKISLNQKNQQAVFLALQKKEELIFDATDYDEKKIAISCRYIEATGWGVITKIDMQEILAPADELKWMTLKIGLSVLFGLFIVSIILATSIVKPINKISETAKQISEGEWKKRVIYNSSNELGELANSFNRMTNTLFETQSHLSDKIKELDKSNSYLEKFAFVISHDLKSPLNSVLGIVELLNTGHLGSLDEEGQKMLKILKDKIDHMKEMINGILEFAIVSDELPNQESLDLMALIQDMAVNYKNVATINIVNELPSIKMSKIVAEQLFQNFFTNAIKYNNNNPKTITLSAHKDQEEIVFSITDNGIGIREDYFFKIFDIFQTIAPKDKDSTGIGLAIVKKIVDNYGGKIWVKSKLGDGSTFFFTLPKAQL
ncbi:MAG: sensor histidine kinase [Cytophagales bacterium]|nr:MAG: sensor histidine kinase [Cytophagales bacterium]